jgi:hypothetical protein
MQKFIYELNSNEHDNIEVNPSTRHFATESNNVLLHRSTIKTKSMAIINNQKFLHYNK